MEDADVKDLLMKCPKCGYNALRTPKYDGQNDWCPRCGYEKGKRLKCDGEGFGVPVKLCPACKNDEMHLCAEGGGYYGIPHWHCDNCGHRLSVKDSDRVKSSDYVYHSASQEMEP